MAHLGAEGLLSRKPLIRPENNTDDEDEEEEEVNDENDENEDDDDDEEEEEDDDDEFDEEEEDNDEEEDGEDEVEDDDGEPDEEADELEYNDDSDGSNRDTPDRLHGFTLGKGPNEKPYDVTCGVCGDDFAEADDEPSEEDSESDGDGSSAESSCDNDEHDHQDIHDPHDAHHAKIKRKEDEKRDNFKKAKLSGEEKVRASAIFKACAGGRSYLNEDQFSIALAMMGQRESVEAVKVLFLDCILKEGVQYGGFEYALHKLRAKVVAEDKDAEIKNTFDDLYKGTCPKDDQKDETGNKFIWANHLRNLLTTKGEAPLTDEEADQCIRECHPKYKSGDGSLIASLEGKIFFDQYKAMLLDANPQPPNK